VIRAAFDMTPASSGSPGVARYVVDLAVALDRMDDIEIVRVAAPQAKGSRVRRALATAYRRGLYYPFLLSRESRRKDAQLLHCPGPRVPRRLDVPLVLTIHDMLPWRYPEHLQRQDAITNKVLLGRAAKRASRIIVGSEYSRQEVVELLSVDEHRVTVTPWGLDLRFHPVESSSMWLARRFGIPGRYVLCTGTREPQKNLVTLIDAFERFQLGNPEYTLVVVGDRPAAGSPIERAINGSTARIVRAGFVGDEELVRLYGAADCFVFPSLYEGFGFPPLEAMACGAPVICSDRASLPDLVGNAAMVVDPTDPEVLAAAMRELLSSPLRAGELRERGIERARNYTWSRCAEATARIYDEALADPVEG
jgi:glycosyltransferase involved in cell wall biosynthesis